MKKFNSNDKKVLAVLTFITLMIGYTVYVFATNPSLNAN